MVGILLPGSNERFQFLEFLDVADLNKLAPCHNYLTSLITFRTLGMESYSRILAFRESTISSWPRHLLKPPSSPILRREIGHFGSFTKVGTFLRKYQLL